MFLVVDDEEATLVHEEHLPLVVPRVCTRFVVSASTGRAAGRGWRTDGGRDDQLLERLDRVDLAARRVRRPAAEQALWQHLCAIGADTDDVDWVADIEEGSRRCGDKVRAGAQVWEPSASGSWDRYSLWRPDALFSYPDRDLHRREDPIGAPILRVARASLGRRWRVHRTTRTYRRWRQSYAESLTRSVSTGSRLPPPTRTPSSAQASHAASSSWNRKRADSASWREVREEAGGRRQCGHTRRRDTGCRRSSPLASAWSAGALLLDPRAPAWPRRTCIAVPRPALHLDRRKAPPPRRAGHRVDVRHLLLVLGRPPRPQTDRRQQSERARLQVLVRTRNLELRRLLLDRIGYERFLDIAGTELVAQDDFGKLWRSELQIDGEPLRVVEVVNATPEPDGTYRRYFLRVPPTTRTAREAVAWTFGFDDPATTCSRPKADGDLIRLVLRSGSTCTVEQGVLHDPYTGQTIRFRRGVGTLLAVQIDHVVALADAWRTGASRWTVNKLLRYANDPSVLLAVDGPTNGARSDDDASEWLPPRRSYDCVYAKKQIAIKTKYRLWVEPDEKQALRRTLRTCR